MAKPLRTILFTNVGADLYGADYVLLCLVRSLDPKRFRSLVLVPYEGPLVGELQAAGAIVKVREFPVLRRSVFTLVGLMRFVWQMMTSFLFLVSLARRERADIFHTNTASIWLPGFAAAIMCKPHIWQVMELVESPRFVGWMMAKMTGIFSTKVFCISDAVRHHFLKDNENRDAKFLTLYHGVDPGEYDPARCNRMAMRDKLGIPEDATVVLYAGRFSAWKGQDVFVMALQILFERGIIEKYGVHSIILGSSFRGQEEFENDLDERLQTLPGNQFVYRAGFQRNLPEWMSASDIFVLPSKRPEPNATVLIGAMAMGLACIGTNIGGTVETIENETTGLLISPDSPEVLADAITALLANPQMRADMARAGRARALEVFSISRYCQTICQAYEE